MISRDTVTTNLALVSLRCTVCPACGRPKERKRSFCRDDYFRLPRGLRNALYLPIRGGYEDALVYALRLLGAETFHKPEGVP